MKTSLSVILILFFATRALAETELVREFAAQTSAVKGAVVITHGLNTKPEKMFDLARLLANQGFDVFNVALSGHREGTNIKNVSAPLWLDEMLQVFTTASADAKKQNVPLYFFGYSLGALAGLRTLQTHTDLTVAKMVLLAPPIRINISRGFLALVKHIPGFMVPSFCPKDYRVNNGTSGAAYGGLYDILNDYDQQSRARLNIPTLVIADPKDELVDVKDLKALVGTGDLSNWRFFSVDNTLSANARYHHLIIDEASLGSSQWLGMTERILAFLNATSTSD